jgi:hypothetical protein
MGLFSAVIDRSPVDKFGVGSNAQSLMNLSNISMNRSDELWDPHSKRNQMFQEQSMENAYNLQGQQDILKQRQAARTGQTSLGGFESSASIRDSVRKQQTNLMLSQQGQASQLLGQSGQMQGQAGSMRNSLNSMYRQQQAANQSARQQAKAAKLSVASGIFAGVAGPALGALGGNLAGKIGGAVTGGGGGGGGMFSKLAGGIAGGFKGFNPQLKQGGNNPMQQAFSNYYGGGNFGNTQGGGYLDPNGVSVPNNSVGFNSSGGTYRDSNSLF